MAAQSHEVKQIEDLMTSLCHSIESLRIAVEAGAPEWPRKLEYIPEFPKLVASLKQLESNRERDAQAAQLLKDEYEQKHKENEEKKIELQKRKTALKESEDLTQQRINLAHDDMIKNRVEQEPLSALRDEHNNNIKAHDAKLASFNRSLDKDEHLNSLIEIWQRRIVSVEKLDERETECKTREDAVATHEEECQAKEADLVGQYKLALASLKACAVKVRGDLEVVCNFGKLACYLCQYRIKFA